jgi:hypothetical protein
LLIRVIPFSYGKMLGRAQLEKDDYPHLYSFAKEPFLSMGKASDIATKNIYDLFTLPLSLYYFSRGTK